MDNQILIYSTDNFRQNRKKRFANHQVAGYACQVGFSPDGKWISSGDGSGNVVFWDWKTGNIKSRLKTHSQVVIAHEWLPHETVSDRSEVIRRTMCVHMCYLLILCPVQGYHRLLGWIDQVVGRLQNASRSFQCSLLIIWFSTGLVNTRVMSLATIYALYERSIITSLLCVLIVRLSRMLCLTMRRPKWRPCNTLFLRGIPRRIPRPSPFSTLNVVGRCVVCAASDGDGHVCQIICLTLATRRSSMMEKLHCPQPGPDGQTPRSEARVGKRIGYWKQRLTRLGRCVQLATHAVHLLVDTEMCIAFFRNHGPVRSMGCLSYYCGQRRPTCLNGACWVPAATRIMGQNRTKRTPLTIG